MFTEEGLSVLILSPILAFPARQASAERVSRVLHPLNLLPVCHTMASSSPKATFCFTACLMLSRCVSRGPLLVSWDLSMDTLVGRLFFFLPFLHLALIVCSLQLYLAKQGDQLFCAISYQLLSMSAVPFSSCWNWL